MNIFKNRKYAWKLLIASVFVLLAAAAAFDGYIFWRFSRFQEKEISAATPQISEVNAKTFDNVYNYVKEKERQFAKNLSQKPKVQDPTK